MEWFLLDEGTEETFSLIGGHHQWSLWKGGHSLDLKALFLLSHTAVPGFLANCTHSAIL